MKDCYRRTLADLLEALRYGKVLRVVSEHAGKYVCCRVRTRKGQLIMIPSERETLEHTPGKDLVPSIGDYVFKDNGRRGTWSLWKIVSGDADDFFDSRDRI